jgi:hypothetical protein
MIALRGSVERYQLLRRQRLQQMMSGGCLEVQFVTNRLQSDALGIVRRYQPDD